MAKSYTKNQTSRPTDMGSSELRLDGQLASFHIHAPTIEQTTEPESVSDKELKEQVKILQAAIASKQETLHALETNFNASLVQNLTLRASVLNLWTRIEQTHGAEKIKEWNDELLSRPGISEAHLELISALEDEEAETKRKKACGLFYGKRNLGVDMVEYVDHMMRRRDAKGIALAMDLWCGRARGVL